MADDALTIELGHIGDDITVARELPMTRDPRKVVEGHAPRLLEAVRKALDHHRPRQLYDLVTGYHGKHLCGHDPDYDGDRHFEGDDGLWYCRDKPTVTVCATCIDGGDPDLFTQWPCPTYRDIARELLGEDHD